MTFELPKDLPELLERLNSAIKAYEATRNGNAQICQTLKDSLSAIASIPDMVKEIERHNRFEEITRVRALNAELHEALGWALPFAYGEVKRLRASPSLHQELIKEDEAILVKALAILAKSETQP